MQRLVDFIIYTLCIFTSVTVFAFKLQAHHFRPDPTNTYPDIVFPVESPMGHGTGFVIKYHDKFFVVTAAHVCDMGPGPELTYDGMVERPLVSDMTHDICILPYTKKVKPARYFTLFSDVPRAFTKVEIFSRTDVTQEWTIPGYFLKSARFKDDEMGMNYDAYQLSAVPIPGTSGGPVVLKGTRDVVCIATIVYWYQNQDGSPHYYMGECSTSLSALQVLGAIR